MSTRVKPNTQAALQQVIDQARQTIPFDLTEAQLCSGLCHGCSKKLLNFLEMELDSWETRMDSGEVPTLGDVSSLARMSKKIYVALSKSGLVASDNKMK